LAQTLLCESLTEGSNMDLQAIILKQYMLLNDKPTLKKIAADTGIQLTRVFRIFNGSTMKLSEYQVFHRKVKEKMGLTDSLEEIALECSLRLSPEAIKDLELFLKRKIETWRLLQVTRQAKTIFLTA
jgi:AraC-like DNA-binding protein